jgi:hypothetical protein
MAGELETQRLALYIRYKKIKATDIVVPSYKDIESQMENKLRSVQKHAV